jgi:hypothetical protein
MTGKVTLKQKTDTNSEISGSAKIREFCGQGHTVLHIGCIWCGIKITHGKSSRSKRKGNKELGWTDSSLFYSITIIGSMDTQYIRRFLQHVSAH